MMTIAKLPKYFHFRVLYGKAEIGIQDVSDHDFVEVVRCKDCAWCRAGYCEKYDDLIPFGCELPWEDWFCADGKRR